MFRILELFGGIGGFRVGLHNVAGAVFHCVGYYDIDKYATAVFNYQFGEHYEPQDIREVDARSIPYHDLLCAGFPCQSFSLAGQRRGFSDERGNLFFEIARILADKHPTFVLLENVKGLLSNDSGRTFATILATLWELGYSAEWQVLNSKDFGVPQNRPRVFIVGHLRSEPAFQVFPLPQAPAGAEAAQGTSSSDGARVRDESSSRLIANTLSARYAKDGSENLIEMAMKAHTKANIKQRVQNRDTTWTLDTSSSKQVVIIGNTNPSGSGQSGNVFSPDGIAPTLCAGGGNPRRKRDIGYNTGRIAASDSRIRRLTPIECERLQGFPDGWTAHGQLGDKVFDISDTQRYKMCGNAVTTTVVTAVGTRLWELLQNG